LQDEENRAAITGIEGSDVGERIRVRLVHTDVERGYIDVKKVD
jgi:hypothetical protein